MNLAVAAISVLVLMACVQQSNLDLTPIPLTNASDAEWVQAFDVKLSQSQAETVAKHKGSPDSRIILWEELNCMRGVYVARARAAQALSERKGISRGEAIAETQSDAAWTIAGQGCHQPYRSR